VTTPGGPAAAPGTTTKEPDMTNTTRRTLESLAKLRLPELQARFAELVGEPTRSPNKTFLLRKIGEALEAREQQTNAEPTTPATTTTEASPKVKLTKLSVAELQAVYREVVGRETQSSNSAYLVWKLRQAQKGRIRVGPIDPRAPGDAADVKVLPLRMTAAEVEALDEAWRRLGFKSRTAMIRAVIATYAADRNALLADQALAQR
jgi:hypothetical protein